MEKYVVIRIPSIYGLPEDFYMEKPSSFGTHLVKGLVDQLYESIAIVDTKYTPLRLIVKSTRSHNFRKKKFIYNSFLF